MKFFDSHTHTKFSADSDMDANEALSVAREQGIGLTFTEHIDFGYPGEKKFLFDPEEYWHEYEKLRGDDLMLGVEMGLEPGKSDMSKSFIARVPFDEVIGSIHLIDGKDIYEPNCYEGWSQHDMYVHYLKLMAAMVRENPYIDTLAHIDYIARYAPYDEPNLAYADYAEEIDDVIKALLETDTAMEINTRRFDDGLAMKELVPIYARYRELGGRFVTIGSDAHRTSAIGAYFDLAREMAKECGLTVVTFRERKRELCDE